MPHHAKIRVFNYDAYVNVKKKCPSTTPEKSSGNAMIMVHYDGFSITIVVHMNFFAASFLCYYKHTPETKKKKSAFFFILFKLYIWQSKKKFTCGRLVSRRLTLCPQAISNNTMSSLTISDDYILGDDVDWVRKKVLKSARNCSLTKCKWETFPGSTLCCWCTVEEKQ